MRPKRITDPVLGELVWNPQRLWWEGKCTVPDGASIPLSIHSLGYSTQLPPFEDTTYDRTITPESREALSRVRCAGSNLRSALAEKYLPLYPRWNEGERITEREFKRRLKLEGITLTPEGNAEAFFEDDGMFAGHALIAHLDPDGIVRYVELFG
jgi:hypothetical protein